jgi:hypothetical protein
VKTIDPLPIFPAEATHRDRERPMIRLVLIVLMAVLAWALLLKLVRRVKSASIDWTGVTAIAGFIALAFWLRHITGMG